MAHDDFDVIAYKVLAYVYRCMREGKRIDLDVAWELAGCPPEDYWKTILSSLQANGYLLVNDARYDILGNVITPGSCAITMDGAIYVRDNSKMAKARAFLGKAFEKTLDAAIAIAPAIAQSGMP